MCKALLLILRNALQVTFLMTNNVDFSYLNSQFDLMNPLNSSTD